MAYYSKNYGRSSYRKRKINWKKLITTVLVVILSLALISGMVSLFSKDTKTIYPSFTVGGIDETTGKHLDVKDSIYTKKSFECKGLAVKLDYNAHVTYQAFFYDELDEFISASEKLDHGAVLSVPLEAVNARLVVTPKWDELAAEDDVSVETDEAAAHVIEWYEVSTYANQLEISVLRDQGNNKDGVQLFTTLKEHDIADMVNLNYDSAEFMYLDTVNDVLEGKTVTKIGLPVKTLGNYASENVFTVYKVTGESGARTVVESYTLKIKGNVYSSGTVNEWVYFDVNIELGDGEALAFASKTDTIQVGRLDSGVPECKGYVNKALSSEPGGNNTICLMFDIYYTE